MTHYDNSGEQITLSVHFNNKHFNDAHIRNFVLDSQLDGWQVTYQMKIFTTASITCLNDKTYKMAFMYCFTKDNVFTKLSWKKEMMQLK